MIGRVSGMALAAVLLLAACEPVAPVGSPAPKQAHGSAAPPAGARKNCELKNGPTGCVEHETGARAGGTAKEATARQADAGFEPYMCQQGGGGMIGFWGNLGRISEWQAYCERLEAGQSPPSGGGPYAGSDAAEPSDPVGAGSGCVWKGRSYRPGDTIYASKVGDIFMRDVLIDGKPFYTFVPQGQNLSSPGDRAQMCECQRSVKHWGCV